MFNTDQGSQFTSTAFTGTLAAAGVRISMDGRGRWMDNRTKVRAGHGHMNAVFALVEFPHPATSRPDA
jgi:transposase InsO family protein